MHVGVSLAEGGEGTGVEVEGCSLMVLAHPVLWSY